MIRRTTRNSVSISATASLFVFTVIVSIGQAWAQDPPNLDGVWVESRDLDLLLQVDGDQFSFTTLRNFMSPAGEPNAIASLTDWHGPIAILQGDNVETGLLIAHSPEEVSLMVASEDHTFVFRKLQVVPTALEGEWRGVALPPSPRPENEWTLTVTTQELVLTGSGETTQWQLGALEGRGGQMELLVIGESSMGLLSAFALGDGATFLRVNEESGWAFRQTFPGLIVYRPDARPAWIDEMTSDEELFASIVTAAIMTEAADHVRRLYDSSVSYYDADHTDNIGNIITPRFPDSFGPTPSEVPCGTTHTPTYEDWSADTWEALNFAISDPHYYAYQYESHGTQLGATFTAYAFGDLDCDGVYSTFFRTGEVLLGNDIRGSAGLQEINPTE